MGSAPGIAKDRDAVEQALLHEVEQARAAYEQAKAQSAKSKEYLSDLGPSHPDGCTALQKATATQSAATERYVKALKALTEFMVGKTWPH